MKPISDLMHIDEDGYSGGAEKFSVRPRKESKKHLIFNQLVIFGEAGFA